MSVSDRTDARPALAGEDRSHYRPDIDGLRAIAVLPVVFYHYGVPGFPGGFVGVDVFFVISGYLITSLIFGEMRKSRFSVTQFYERRVRRILPALFTMLFATFAATLVFLFPRDLERFAKSAITTVLFVGNFEFWQEAGYFDTRADFKPLLHTWSLAVEEQFYVFFPAILYLMHTAKRSSLLWLTGSLAVASFALSVWALRAYPVAAFYLAPYRTWELMLGAVLALGQFPQPRLAWMSDAILAAGLLLIAWPIAVYTAATPFPAEAAVPPCMGAALVIYAGERRDALLTRLLSSAPLVFIGLISYSLYLWHWPLLVFARYGARAPLPAAELGALMAASVLLAFLSWRFIERPFRNRSGWVNRTRLIWIFCTTGAAMIAVGVLFLVSHGLPERYSPKVQRILAEANDTALQHHTCFNSPVADVLKGNICTIGDAKAAKPSFILIGDSHAAAFLPAVEQAERALGHKGYVISRGFCPPIMYLRLSDETSPRCAALNGKALQLASGPDVTTVIFVARWAMYEKGDGYGLDSGTRRTLIDLGRQVPAGLDQHDQFAFMLERSIKAYQALGKIVVVVGPSPEPGISVPEALAQDAIDARTTPLVLPRSSFEAREGGVRSVLAALAAKYPIRLVDPASVLCSPTACELERDGRPLYTDHSHLSAFGAAQLVPSLKAALQH